MIPIIVLHGWAIIVNPKWKAFIKELKSKKYQVYFPTIPGLSGKELDKAWTLDDYSSWLIGYINKLKSPKVYLIGHSFGGSIALKTAINFSSQIDKMVLIGCAGIREKSWKKSLYYSLAKTFKISFIIIPFSLIRDFFRSFYCRILGSGDYAKAKGVMQETFKNIVQEDLKPNLDKINVPTLLLWGENDKDTPLRDGRLMPSLIRGSKLVVFKKGGHSLPFTHHREIVKRICEFIKKN